MVSNISANNLEKLVLTGQIVEFSNNQLEHLQNFEEYDLAKLKTFSNNNLGHLGEKEIKLRYKFGFDMLIKAPLTWRSLKGIDCTWSNCIFWTLPRV